MKYSDYFIHNEIAFFIVERIETDFIFKYMNHHYSRFIKLEHPITTVYKAHEIMSAQVFQEFCHYSSLLKEEADSVKYISNGYNMYPLPLTHALYSFKIDTRNYIACTISSNDSYLYEYQPNQKSSGLFSLFQDNYSFLTSLSYSEEDHFITIDMNVKFCNYLNIVDCETGTTKNINEIFPDRVVEFFSTGFIHCIKTRCPTNQQLLYQYTDEDSKNYYMPQEGIFFLNITFVPKISKHSLSCYCYTRDVSQTRHDVQYREELLLEYDTIFNSTMNAIAIYSVFDNYELKLDKYNKRMEVFVNRFPDILINLIEENNSFLFIIKEQTPLETNITFDVRGEPYHIQVSIVPVIRNLMVIKLIITLLTITSALIQDSKPIYSLTRREQEIVSLVAQGRKNDYIAKKLKISTGTVKKTLSNVYKKLSINSRVELVKYYLKDNK